MATLHLFYEPGETPRIRLEPDCVQALSVRQAHLSVDDDLDGKDVYDIARRLAELLLEQMT